MDSDDVGLRRWVCATRLVEAGEAEINGKSFAPGLQCGFEVVEGGCMGWRGAGEAEETEEVTTWIVVCIKVSVMGVGDDEGEGGKVYAYCVTYLVFVARRAR